MPATFLTSDTHFGHGRMVRDDNRPFTTVEEMNETLIENWNKVVGPKDLIYHLGDVVMNRRYFAPVMARLNGRKRLIRGNHDVLRLSEYSEFFEDILGVKVMDDCILSHIPLHINQMNRFHVNVHGHTHKNIVTTTPWNKPDPHYICVCVEQTNYTPISYDTIRAEIKKRFPS